MEKLQKNKNAYITAERPNYLNDIDEKFQMGSTRFFVEFCVKTYKLAQYHGTMNQKLLSASCHYCFFLRKKPNKNNVTLKSADLHKSSGILYLQIWNVKQRKTTTSKTFEQYHIYSKIILKLSSAYFPTAYMTQIDQKIRKYQSLIAIQTGKLATKCCVIQSHHDHVTCIEKNISLYLYIFLVHI